MCFCTACGQGRVLLSSPMGLLIPWACLLASQEYSTLLSVKGSFYSSR